MIYRGRNGRYLIIWLSIQDFLAVDNDDNDVNTAAFSLRADLDKIGIWASTCKRRERKTKTFIILKIVYGIVPLYLQDKFLKDLISVYAPL